MTAAIVRRILTVPSARADHLLERYYPGVRGPRLPALAQIPRRTSGGRKEIWRTRHDERVTFAFGGRRRTCPNHPPGLESSAARWPCDSLGVDGNSLRGDRRRHALSMSSAPWLWPTRATGRPNLSMTVTSRFAEQSPLYIRCRPPLIRWSRPPTSRMGRLV